MLPEGSETQAPGELAQLGEDAAVVLVVWQSWQKLGLTRFRAGCRGTGWRRHSPDHSKDMGQGPDLAVPHKRQCHTDIPAWPGDTSRTPSGAAPAGSLVKVSIRRLTDLTSARTNC